jgi:hypothetical protein
MQVLKVEPWVAGDDHTHSGIFDCWIVLEGWEYAEGLSKAIDVEVVRRDLETMRVTMRVLIRAKDELAAFRDLPALITEGEDRALRNRS